MINIFEIMEGEKTENNSCAIDESVLIPKGNILKLRVIARNSKNEIEPGICQTKTGLKYANFGFKVLEGEFKNRVFYDYIYLPPKMQEISLKPGQHDLCVNNGRKLQNIWAVTHDLRVKSQLSFETFLDYDGLEFTGKIGQTEFNGVKRNTLDQVITKPETMQIKNAPAPAPALVVAKTSVDNYGPQKMEDESLIDDYNDEYGF